MFTTCTVTWLWFEVALLVVLPVMVVLESVVSASLRLKLGRALGRKSESPLARSVYLTLSVGFAVLTYLRTAPQV